VTANGWHRIGQLVFVLAFLIGFSLQFHPIDLAQGQRFADTRVAQIISQDISFFNDRVKMVLLKDP
jgi:hypothetical protein